MYSHDAPPTQNERPPNRWISPQPAHHQYHPNRTKIIRGYGHLMSRIYCRIALNLSAVLRVFIRLLQLSQEITVNVFYGLKFTENSELETSGVTAPRLE